MVESLDLHRIADYLQMDPIEVIDRYMEISAVAWGIPILLMKTASPDVACTFLKDGKCSIYSKRPRACKLYPLSIGPDDKLKDFLIFSVSGEQHHFVGRWYRAEEWLNTNFGTVDRYFVKTEYRFLRECGQIMRRIPRDREEDVVFQMLRWRYFQYDMDRSFLTQYVDNMQMLKIELKKLTTRKDEKS